MLLPVGIACVTLPVFCTSGVPDGTAEYISLTTLISCSIGCGFWPKLNAAVKNINAALKNKLALFPVGLVIDNKSSGLVTQEGFRGIEKQRWCKFTIFQVKKSKFSALTIRRPINRALL